MPNITAAGSYDKGTPNFDFLGKAAPKKLLFAGSSLGSSVLVQYYDDTNTLRTVEGGQITQLPTSIKVNLNRPLTIVVAGSPDFNVSSEE